MTDKAVSANAHGDVSRMLRARVISVLDEMEGKSKDGRTAFSVALKAMTSASAAVQAGDSGAVEWCKSVLSERVGPRTIERASKYVSESETQKTLAGAIASIRRKGLSAKSGDLFDLKETSND